MSDPSDLDILWNFRPVLELVSLHAIIDSWPWCKLLTLVFPAVAFKIC
jgi:hypothetical protein